jgi:UDP-2,4-diacetamido-2,4,6-trideoxy-beta-L-altropyranose hydrolase
LYRRLLDVTTLGWVCEAGPRVGFGHLRRGLAVAESWPGRFIVCIGEGADYALRFAAEQGVSVEVRRWSECAGPGETDLAEVSVLVVDHYELPLTLPARRIVVVDDWMRDRIEAVGLINANVGALRSDYLDSSVELWALGPEYAMVRRAFRAVKPVEPRESAATVLVLFGGADPHHLTRRVCEALSATDWFKGGGTIVGVLGASAAEVEPAPAVRRGGVRFHRDPKDFPRLCAEADMAVTAGGTMVYELCYLGLPFVPVAQVDNNERIVAALSGSGIGSGISRTDPDWLDRVVADVEVLASSHTARRELSARCRALVDGGGADRVARFLQTIAAGEM